MAMTSVTTVKLNIGVAGREMNRAREPKPGQQISVHGSARTAFPPIRRVLEFRNKEPR